MSSSSKSHIIIQGGPSVIDIPGNELGKPYPIVTQQPAVSSCSPIAVEQQPLKKVVDYVEPVKSHMFPFSDTFSFNKGCGGNINNVCACVDRSKLKTLITSIMANITPEQLENLSELASNAISKASLIGCSPSATGLIVSFVIAIIALAAMVLLGRDWGSAIIAGFFVFSVFLLLFYANTGSNACAQLPKGAVFLVFIVAVIILFVGMCLSNY